MNLPLANGEYCKPAGILAKLFGFLGLAVWFFHLYVFLQYDATRPLRLDRSTGRIYAQNDHGHVVYLTKAEDVGLTQLEILAFSLVGASAVTAGLFVENGLGKRPAHGRKNSGELVIIVVGPEVGDVSAQQLAIAAVEV